jgi:hypothetical protein
MKTFSATAFISVATLAVAAAQQKLDVTVHDGNRLRPGASQKETSDWMKSRIIEQGLAAALEQARAPAQSPFSPEQIQLIKVCVIRGKILDQLIADEPRLRPEADALYVQYDGQLTQQKLPSNPALSAEQVHLLVTLAMRATICDQLLKSHPDLKSKADALYVQYDSEVSGAIIKVQKGAR